MSIAVVCTVPDGVVIGADSAITVAAPEGVLKVFEDAEKVFPLTRRSSPSALRTCLVGAATYGLGLLGNRTVEAHMREFCADRLQAEPECRSVEGVCRELRQWLAERYDREVRPRVEQQHNLPLDRGPDQQRPHLGVVVAGYSGDAHSPEVWGIEIPARDSGDGVRQHRRAGDFGATWSGMGQAVSRFIHGVDPDTVNQLVELLRAKRGIELAETDWEAIRAIVRRAECRIPFEAMPLQEAVDLCKFLLSLPINYAKFQVGAPVCGGPIRLAVISKASGFSWVQRPELQVRPI